VPGTLDRLSEFALLGRTDGGDAAGDNLATFGDESLKQADILVIDLWRKNGRAMSIAP
jgi:hypothetical protein